LTGKKMGPPLHHGDGVKYAEFSHNSKYVVTTSEDATARVWEVPSGKPAPFLLQHQPGTTVTEAHFSLDDGWIVTASSDKTARVWDAQTGEPVTPPLKHGWQFWYVQFINDDQEVFTRRSIGNGGQTMIWELPIDKRNPKELAELVTVLSGYRPDNSGAVTLQTPEELLNAWETLKSEDGGDFTVSAEDVMNWHLLEAQACENEAIASKDEAQRCENEPIAHNSEAKARESEALIRESAKQWKAAEFHWKRLVRANPDDTSFNQHLNQARELAGKTNSVPGH
jgi:hypothetical protein